MEGDPGGCGFCFMVSGFGADLVEISPGFGWRCGKFSYTNG
jgi:hypothetical protein